MPEAKNQQQDPAVTRGTRSPGDCPEPTVMSPALLRRLGEAAAGFPDAKEQWWIARIESLNGEFEPDGPFPTADEARAKLDGRPGFEVFGPFRAPTGPMGSVLTHVTRVTVEFDEGEPLVLQGRDYDALFWGFPAIEKFAIPYYVSVSGIEYGLKIHEAVTQNLLVLAHAPDTEYRIYYIPEAQFVRELTPLL